VLFKRNFLRIIFLFVIYLGIFFLIFFPNISFSTYYLDNFDTADRCSQNEEPTIITSNFTEVRNGDYFLVARNELNVVYIFLSPEYSFGVPSIVLEFIYSKNVTFSVSFSMVFLGSEQINNSELVIAAVPITINSSEFSNWTVSTSIVSNRYQKDSVAFYYITSRDFIRLETIYSEYYERYDFFGEFQGNGTYVFLGIIKEPQPFWTTSFFYIGLGLFAVQLVVIALIVKFVTGFIFGKNEE